jgi:RsiW-degrading membrane proteinase PrsW (M82 family)
MILSESIVVTGFIVAIVIAAIYGTLSLCYYVYRYAKGDDHPSIADLNLNPRDMSRLINPFYYKHPMNIVVTTSLLGGLSVLWPVLIPAGVTYYAVNKIREKNLHKKKMWNILKES